MKVGKPLFGSGKMGDSEYVNEMEFINNRFMYLYPQNDAPTPEYICQRFYEAIKKHNVDVVVVDPWNQMSHRYQGREDEYLSEMLRIFKNFAMKNQVVFNIVCHTNSRLERNSRGDIDLPFYDRQLAGGNMWGNKCDNIILSLIHI